jgi:hypothetical protein
VMIRLGVVGRDWEREGPVSRLLGRIARALGSKLAQRGNEADEPTRYGHSVTTKNSGMFETKMKPQEKQSS